MNISRKIISMLKENTGIHMLDSGGAYGRYWQSNQKIRNWKKKPKVIVDIWDDSFTLSLDVYHFLCDRLIWDEDCKKWTEKLHKFAKDYDGWIPAVDDFLTKNNMIGDLHNTYNGECLLTQTLQFWWVKNKNEDWPEYFSSDGLIILQIHNGCDVRGGYTKPVFFKLKESACYFADYCRVLAYVHPKVVYDKDQIEAFNLPRDEGFTLETDDGYHWYCWDDLFNGKNVENLFEVKDGQVIFDGRKVEFYID